MKTSAVSSETITIQQAADLLNVSRTYVVKHVLDKENTPSHRCGKKREVYTRDVLAYMKRREIETDEIMAELAALSQHMGLME